MKKTLLLILILLVAVPSLAADTLTFRDKLGREIRVALPVQRAVLFETYELTAALGVWSRIAGVSRYAYENDLILAVKPDIRKAIPSAGSGADINMEALLKLRPDLVVTWTLKPETVRFMEEKGMTVIALYPENISELYEAMRLQGKLFGKERKVEQTLFKMEKLFSLAKKRTSGKSPEKREKIIWLGSKPTTVTGGAGINHDLIGLINGINPAEGIRARSRDVSMERIIAWNPGVIFIWGGAKYKPADLLNHPQWRHVEAVRKGRVYQAPKWSTWSPRLSLIALWMAMKTYPEDFKDLDFERAVDDFYRSVFGISYRKASGVAG